MLTMAMARVQALPYGCAHSSGVRVVLACFQPCLALTLQGNAHDRSEGEGLFSRGSFSVARALGVGESGCLDVSPAALLGLRTA